MEHVLCQREGTKAAGNGFYRIQLAVTEIAASVKTGQIIPDNLADYRADNARR